MKRKINEPTTTVTGSRPRGGGAAIRDISFKRMAVGSLCGLAVAMAVAMIFAALINAGKLPYGKPALFAGISVFLGGIAASVISSGKRRMALSAGGACAGLLLLLLIFGAGLFAGFFSVKYFVMVLIILAVSCILGSMISTLIIKG